MVILQGFQDRPDRAAESHAALGPGSGRMKALIQKGTIGMFISGTRKCSGMVNG